MANPTHYGHPDSPVTVYPPTDTYDRWRIVWYDPDGTRRNTARVDRDDAHTFASDIARQLDELPDDPAANPGSMSHRTVNDLAAWFLHPDSRDEPWSANHLRNQEGIVSKWMLPRIGDRPCRTLTKADMVGILNDARAEVGVHQVRAIGACMRRMVNVGAEAGYFDSGHDPMRGVKYTIRSSRQGQASYFVPLDRRPDTQSVEALADAMVEVTGEWWRGLQVRLTAYSGLRWGETVAAADGQVDLELGTFDVVRQVTETNGTRHRHAPKYGKVRTTFIPSFLHGDLERRLAEDLPEAPETVCDCREAVPGGGRILFPAPEGGYDWHYRFSESRFRPACELAGWPSHDPCRHKAINHEVCWKWSWHDLRHHFCTWALAAPSGEAVEGVPSGLGLEVADVAYFAGHSSPDFTLKAYVSTRKGAVDRARAASVAVP